ncbi:MAG: TAXI family TRAP transporter solute-binding subunit [Deltaproteobacteria bacterium]|nr:TAXI family TRAP transporter solute-binding subunit [Deltaproteobacteria bacterium]MBW2306279.1 TAXI family TRAP transporter solute-binding subunit [Deltaproteobacteria bacterium]
MKLKPILMVACLGMVSFALLMVPFGSAMAESEVKKLVFTAGPAGGGWYGLAGAISELIKAKFPGMLVTVTPGGGVGNITVVDKGKAQLGLSIAHLYKSAMMGTDPYKSVHKNLKALIKFGVSDMGIFLVKKDVPLTSIEDLKKKKYPLRLTTTGKASTPALAAKRLLQEYGVTFDDLKSWGGSVTFTSYADAASLIADGHADATITVTVPAIRELVRRVKMRWLDPDEAVVESMVGKYGYAKNFINKGKYPWAVKKGWTIGEPNVIIIRADIPDKVAYTIAKAICEKPDTIRNFGAHYKGFDPKTAWKDVGGPLHPGAEKFYRDAGYMK